MNKPNAASLAAATFRRFLWLVVLVPILGVSAYSLYVVARYLGVPPEIAWCMSTCFDGAALLAAEYSLRYAQAGLSGSAPRTVVRLFAGVAAYLQTFHARLGHELPGSWVMWASLPVGAVLVYEIHIHWERRKALARAGVRYPAPLPAFGLATWVLFPVSTIESLRIIVGRRKDTIVAYTQERPAIAIVDDIKTPASPKTLKTPKATAPKAPSTQRPRAPKAKSHAPVIHIRNWARERGHQVGDRARLPRYIVEEYERENGGAG